MVRVVINGMFLLGGSICAFISGYVGYHFLILLGPDFAKFAIFLIIAFEIVKIASIFYYEYAKRSSRSKPLGDSLSITIIVTRFVFITMSCVFFMFTVSAYMDNAQYDIELNKKKKEITEMYDKKYKSETIFLNQDVESAGQQAYYQMNNEVKGQWKGTRYEESSKLVKAAKKHREERLDYILYQRDSTVRELENSLRNDIKSQSKIIQGAFNNFTRMGVNLESGSFSAKVIWWIGFGITILIEMIIWLSCGILGSILADSED